MTIPVCLPARWGATRLPGKLAARWGDAAVLAATAAIAAAADLGPVIVLSDDPRLDAVVPGVRVVRVNAPVRNGSERVAWALAHGLLGDPPIVVNLQADAVGASPAAVRAAVQALLDDPGASLATAAVRAPREAVRGRTTVATAGGRALYFSRHLLPAPHTGPASVLAHIGVYAYRSDRLRALAERPPGPLELAEGLEQLRWLEAGDAIALAIVPGDASLAHAIDRQDDLA